MTRMRLVGLDIVRNRVSRCREGGKRGFGRARGGSYNRPMSVSLAHAFAYLTRKSDAGLSDAPARARAPGYCIALMA